VNAHGIGHDGVEIAEVFRELLDLYLHLCGRGAGMLLRVGYHQGHHVAVAIDLVFAQHPAAGHHDGRALVHLALGHHVGAARGLDVHVGYDLDNAWHPFGCGAVNLEDPGMVRDPGLHEGCVKGSRRHLEFLVVAIVGQAADFGQRRRADHGLAIKFPIFGRLEGKVFHCLFAAHDFGGGHHGVDDLLVARAAADVEVLLKPVTHLFARGAAVFEEQGIGGHDKSRGAKTALHRSEMHKGRLQGMEVGRCADALDGQYLAVLLDVANLGDTGAHELAVQYHRARATDPTVATDLGACQPHAAQHIRQRIRFRIADKDAIRAIDVQPHLVQFHVSPPWTRFFVEPSPKQKAASLRGNEMPPTPRQTEQKKCQSSKRQCELQTGRVISFPNTGGVTVSHHTQCSTPMGIQHADRPGESEMYEISGPAGRL